MFVLCIVVHIIYVKCEVKYVNINPTGGKPLYEQLMFGIKQDILLGVLQPGDKLPSVREMAQRQLVNPNTVAKAYKALENQEVIQTVMGRGTFVAQHNEEREIDARELKKFKAQFKDLMTEVMYLGLNKQDLIKLIYDWYGGDANETRGK